jgi:hypothetical protein
MLVHHDSRGIARWQSSAAAVRDGLLDPTNRPAARLQSAGEERRDQILGQRMW